MIDTIITGMRIQIQLNPLDLGPIFVSSLVHQFPKSHFPKLFEISGDGILNTLATHQKAKLFFLAEHHRGKIVMQYLFYLFYL
jgi:hypothetical protein